MTRDPIHLGERLSAAELARRMEVPVNRVIEILNGCRAVTGDTALRMGRSGAVTVTGWCQLRVASSFLL